MKKFLIISITLILCLTGCNKTTKIDQEKDDYLAIKQELLNSSNFTNKDDLPFDLNIYVNRINDEEISYRAIIDNEKENMHDIKAILIHNYFTNDIFPSIGIFDDGVDLLTNSEEVKGISLVGYISSTKDINNLEYRVYIEYKTDNDETNKIYYKSTI